MHSRSIQHYIEHIIAKIDNTKLSFKAIATEQMEIDFNAQFRGFHINELWAPFLQRIYTTILSILPSSHSTMGRLQYFP